jgi:hypothetical protein
VPDPTGLTGSAREPGPAISQRRSESRMGLPGTALRGPNSSRQRLWDACAATVQDAFCSNGRLVRRLARRPGRATASCSLLPTQAATSRFGPRCPPSCAGSANGRTRVALLARQSCPTWLNGAMAGRDSSMEVARSVRSEGRRHLDKTLRGQRRPIHCRTRLPSWKRWKCSLGRSAWCLARRRGDVQALSWVG